MSLARLAASWGSGIARRPNTRVMLIDEDNPEGIPVIMPPVAARLLYAALLSLASESIENPFVIDERIAFAGGCLMDESETFH